MSTATKSTRAPGDRGSRCAGAAPRSPSPSATAPTARSGSRPRRRPSPRKRSDRSNLAEPAAGRMAGDARYAAHVDAGRRQDAAGARAPPEPLVERPAVSDLPRADDDPDAVRVANAHGGVRLRQPPARARDERRREPGRAAAGPGGRRVLPGVPGPAGRARGPGEDLARARRGGPSDPVRRGPDARVVRARPSPALLPDAVARRSDPQAVRGALPGQVEPGAFLLGCFRSRAHPVLRPAG